MKKSFSSELRKIAVGGGDSETYCLAVHFAETTKNSAELADAKASPMVASEDERVRRDAVASRDGQVQCEAVAKTALFSEAARPVRKRFVWKKVWSVVATMVVAVVALVAVVLVGLRIAGFRTFTVMSGSMEPKLPVGSLIYVKPVDYTALKVGDVISYVANDDKTVVTHRITSIEVDENDTSVWRFQTQGDANSTPDAKWVHYKNVLGTPAIVVPLIGYVAHNIQQPPGIYIVLVVGTLLLAWTFLPGTLEERRKTARKSIA